MWFETLTSLELDRLIEFEATHCLIVAAVKGARLNVNLFVPVKKIFIDFVNSKLVLAPTL